MECLPPPGYLCTIDFATWIDGDENYKSSIPVSWHRFKSFLLLSLLLLFTDILSEVQIVPDLVATRYSSVHSAWTPLKAGERL
ncbi:hypothetical protein PoB_000227700 [Plakobranchus ocellatus]|uniref:Uncharacterized protein n=1 Tax=Plakobranchus ocellatus TaxID=259542 RepID=A0AAV3Y0Y2_9GAST|nr:hypothetical protein PoB_000227700 [Plakobranchus ocellatus]